MATSKKLDDYRNKYVHVDLYNSLIDNLFTLTAFAEKACFSFTSRQDVPETSGNFLD